MKHTSGRHTYSAFTARHTYSGNITLGLERPQQFSVVFDTASGQIVVPGASCKSPACLMRQRYQIFDSPSARPVNLNGSLPGENREGAEVSWSVADDFVATADDNWSIAGQFVRETVCVGGGGSSVGGDRARGACRQMSVLVARSLSNDPFMSLAFDGIFGLGLNGLSASPAFNFVGALLDSSRGVSRFGIYLSGGDGHDGGELAMASFNPARLRSPLAWTTVASPEMGYWQVRIRAVRIGDKVLEVCRQGGCRGIVDSGCSQLGVPLQQMSKFVDGLTGVAQELTDCRLAKAPILTLELDNGVLLTLGARDLMRDPSPDARLSRAGLADEPQLCKPRLVPVSLGEPFVQNLFVLGEPVLRRYYTAFEWRKEASRVGFGLADHGWEELAEDMITLV